MAEIAAPSGALELAPAVADSKVSLAILDLVKVGQAQNGLRHNDYARYRQYCARRLTHIRHAREINFTFGKGKKFVQRELTAEDVTHDRHLQIPLINAERAWATAMEEKADADTAAGRHKVLGRLKKAVRWAAELRTLAAARADGHTLLEAEAYASWMRAQFELECDSLEAALASLVSTRQIYEQLGRLASRRQREVFEQRIEEMAPQERQCRYNLSRRKGVSVAAAAKSAATSAESDASSSLRPDLLAALAGGRRGGAAGGGAVGAGASTVLWRRTLLAVQSEALRAALLAASERSAQLSAQQQLLAAGGSEGAPGVLGNGGGTEALYLDVLTKYDTAARLATEEATRAAREGKPAVSADYKAIEEYCQFLKLRHALDRSISVHASLAEAAMLISRLGEGAAAPAAAAAGEGSPATGGSSHFVSRHALLRALAAPSAAGDAPLLPASGVAHEPWGALASKCAAVYTRSLTTLDEMAALCSNAAGSGGASVASTAGAPSSSSTADALPADEPLLAALAARRSLLLARRCWFLALAQIAARRRADAAALLGRVEERVAGSEALFAAAAEVEALPAAPVPISSIDEGAAAASAAPGSGGGGGGARGHTSHVLAGVSAEDLRALADLRRGVSEQRLALEAEALLEAALGPRLRADAGVRDAYAAFVAAEPAASGAPLAPPLLERSSTGVSLSQRLDPRRALSGAPVEAGEAALLAGIRAPGRGLGPLLAPLPVPLKPILLDVAFAAGIAYPELGHLVPAAAAAAAAATAGTKAAGAGAVLPQPLAAAAPAPAPAAAASGGGGLLGWLTGRK